MEGALLLMGQKNFPIKSTKDYYIEVTRLNTLLTYTERLYKLCPVILSSMYVDVRNLNL
jgi:hypothetical protein